MTNRAPLTELQRQVGVYLGCRNPEPVRMHNLAEALAVKHRVRHEVLRLVQLSQEAEIRRLLGYWVSELEPSAIWSRDGALVGIGPADLQSTEGHGLVTLWAWVPDPFLKGFTPARDLTLEVRT